VARLHEEEVERQDAEHSAGQGRDLAAPDGDEQHREQVDHPEARNRRNRVEQRDKAGRHRHRPDDLEGRHRPAPTLRHRRPV
jgi:hypothetical protein